MMLSALLAIVGATLTGKWFYDRSRYWREVEEARKKNGSPSEPAEPDGERAP